MKKLKFIALLSMTVGVIFISCDQSFTSSEETKEVISQNSVESHEKSMINASSSGLSLSSIKNFDDINVKLQEEGLNIRLAYAETVTLSKEGEQAIGQTIFANDRTKQLGAQWVANDSRRNADGDNITYLVDQTFSTANGSINSEPSIDASFDTWNKIKKNSKLNIVKAADTGAFPSAIFGGGNPFLADITELGFLPGFYFDSVLGAGSSQNVLGVTFTFNFVDNLGNPSDINSDGFSDVALKEVWYNDNFLWTSDSNGAGTDIETVALHENGHALGFGHFGKISITNSNNKLHISPRAVMNAIVLGTQRDLLGTDRASFNSIYGNWPGK